MLRQILLILFFIVLSGLQFSAQASSNIENFTQNKVAHQGYFPFYYDEDEGKVYLEITQFEQAFIFQSSLPYGIGSNDIGLDRGQLGETRLVQFERVGNKVFLRQLNSYYRANTQNDLEKQSVNEAFASSIIWGFKVIKSDKAKQKTLIDYTPFLLSDIHRLTDKLKNTKQGNFKVDISRSAVYNKRSKAFPNNTELEAIVTYTGSGAGSYLQSVTPDASAISVHLHHSLIKLPDDQYQTRTFHPNSGYWSIEYADYASAIDQPLIQRVIPRHRLKKKNPQAKVSEAIKPIIYYLDAGVPEPVRSALLDGAKWWDQAFAAIGYKNAFQVKMLPKDVDPMDVRYNVIQWVHRATRGWSYGASVIDPRTGEILKGHVTLGSLRVRQDYLIALGLTSPFTDKNADTSKMKAMALARIRQLSAHEVGHTLGIAHNFAASANNRASVMDYPHPLIEIKNGQLNLSNAYTASIGAWDKLVIAYGYSEFPKHKTPQKLANILAQAKVKKLAFISDPDARPPSGAHPTAHLWDNGSNAASELLKVLKIRKIALTNFGINSIAIGTPFSELEQTLAPIYNFHRYQVEAAAKLIAGVNYAYDVKQTTTLNNALITTVDTKLQHQALNALLTTLNIDTLLLPKHIRLLIPPKAYGYSRNRESLPSKTGLTFDPVTIAEASAEHTLGLLLNKARLARLQQQWVEKNNSLSIEKLITKLVDQTVYKKTTGGLAQLIHQRVNQLVINHLLTLYLDKKVVPEVRAEILLSLVNIEKWLLQQTLKKNEPHYLAHYLVLAKQITYTLEKGKQFTPSIKTAMPPGSPIG